MALFTGRLRMLISIALGSPWKPQTGRPHTTSCCVVRRRSVCGPPKIECPCGEKSTWVVDIIIVM